MPEFNATQSKIIEIADKYGYKANQLYTVDRGNGLEPAVTFVPTKMYSPNISFLTTRFGKEVKGVDRFTISHASHGYLSLEDEEEFIKRTQEAIDMCRELNEVDFSDLPTAAQVYGQRRESRDVLREAIRKSL